MCTGGKKNKKRRRRRRNLELQHRTNRCSPSLQTSRTSSPDGRVGSAQCFIHVWMLQELLSSRLAFSHHSPVTTLLSFSNAAIRHHCKYHIFFPHSRSKSQRHLATNQRLNLIAKKSTKKNVAPIPNGSADPLRKIRGPLDDIRSAFKRLKWEAHPKLKFHTFAAIGRGSGEISEM